MSVITLQVRLPSIECSFCGLIQYPNTINVDGLPDTLGIHRNQDIVVTGICLPQYAITGFTQADLESQAASDGWTAVTIYGKTLRVCPKCQRKGSGPGFTERLKNLTLLLAIRQMINAPSFEACKEMAAQIIRDAEPGRPELGSHSTPVVPASEESIQNYRELHEAAKDLLRAIPCTAPSSARTVWTRLRDAVMFAEVSG